MCSPLQQAMQSTTPISIADERLQSKWKVARAANRRRLLTGWRHSASRAFESLTFRQ